MSKYFLLIFWFALATLIVLYGPDPGQQGVAISYVAGLICLIVGVASWLVRR